MPQNSAFRFGGFAAITALRFVILVASLVAPSGAAAHELLMTYIAHTVRVVIGATNIDIQVDLTFNEMASLAERRRADQNQDGDIAESEIVTYLARIESGLSHDMKLVVDGRSVGLFPLYSPQLDLLGVDAVKPVNHILRLSLFARTPASLAAGQELVLADHLWSEAPAQCSFQAQGLAGIQIEIASPNETISDPDARNEHRSVRMKILTAPPKMHSTD